MSNNEFLYWHNWRERKRSLGVAVGDWFGGGTLHIRGFRSAYIPFSDFIGWAMKEGFLQEMVIPRKNSPDKKLWRITPKGRCVEQFPGNDI